MSADAPTPPSPEPTPPPSDEPVSLDPLPHKRRYRKSGREEEDAPDSDSEIIVLSSLLQSLLKKNREPAAASEPKPAAKINRFAVRNAPVAPAPAERPDAETAVADEKSAGAVAPAPPVLPKLKPREFRPEGDPGWGTPSGSRARPVLYFAFTTAVAIAAFLIGRNDARRSNTAKAPAPTAAVWTAVPLSRLDQALAADQTGDIQAAKQLATDLKQHGHNSLLLDVYLQSLETRLGRTNDAESDLSHLLLSHPLPEDQGWINQGLAFDYVRARDFPHALESFAAITEADPFTAANFYHWGDTLRRSGSMPDALEKFRQTLLRLPPNRPELESQRECAEFKMRLCLIEMGREAEIRPAIEEHLRAPSPSGYWLLTASASALQRGDYPAAIEALTRASTVLSPTMFAGLTDDYFFHAYSYRADVAKVIPPEDPANKQKRMAQPAYFVDP